MAKYLGTKEKSLENSILGIWQEAAKKMDETNKNNRSDDGEGLDAVQPKAVKKKFKDRIDKDIDNDGDTDDSDKFLHKKRKAISKAMKKEEMSGKDVAKRMMKIQTMKAFANKVAKMKTVSRDDLEKMLPDYIDGGDITKVLKEGTWHLPDSSKLKSGLKKLMQKPIKLGKEGDDATDAVSEFIGDDELFDAIHDAGNKDPNGDARPIIKKHLKRLGIKEDVELDEGYSSKEIKMAIGIASDPRYAKGNMTGAVNAIEKIKKGLSQEKQVAAVLKRQNEEVEENYDIGTDEYRNHTINTTPGQSKEDFEKQMTVMQEKNNTMRSILAKMWGIDEGKNPFDKTEQEEKPTKNVKKTMTGKPVTKVEIDPKTKDV